MRNAYHMFQLSHHPVRQLDANCTYLYVPLPKIHYNKDVTRVNNAYTWGEYPTRIRAKPQYKKLNIIYTKVQLYSQVPNIYKVRIYASKGYRKENKREGTKISHELDDKESLIFELHDTFNILLLLQNLWTGSCKTFGSEHANSGSSISDLVSDKIKETVI